MTRFLAVIVAVVGSTAWACSIENPWDEAVNPGHYRGFEWARLRDVASCSYGNSRSFYEGCLEYVRQAEACEAE